MTSVLKIHTTLKDGTEKTYQYDCVGNVPLRDYLASQSRERRDRERRAQGRPPPNRVSKVSEDDQLQIVRLRNEQHLTFGQIANELQTSEYIVRKIYRKF